MKLSVTAEPIAILDACLVGLFSLPSNVKKTTYLVPGTPYRILSCLP